METPGAPEEKEKAGKKGCWIAVAIVILIIIAAGIGLMNYGEEDDTGMIWEPVEVAPEKG